MKMMNSGPINSPNFSFLEKHDPLLLQYAVRAERYVFDDPNTALMKLRQFAELLAQLSAARAGIQIEEKDSFLDVLNQLWDRRIIDRDIAELFHGVRKQGNDAAHAHFDDQRQALHHLKLARRLAVWFHRLFGKQKNFDPGKFVAPPNPQEASAALLAELDELRDQLVKAEGRIESAEMQTEEIARLKNEAEERAKLAYESEATALDLAAETEEILTQERNAWQGRLAELQATAAASSSEEKQELVEQAQEVSSSFDLDEQETRYLIDQQLRDAGWEADTQTMSYSSGSRPVKNRNMAISEWPTSKGPADYVLFIGLTPVAVVEAKRKNKNCSSSIQQAKRYSRNFQIKMEQVSPGGPWEDFQIPFLFSTNGRKFLQQLQELSGIWFLDARRPTNHPRALESWYTPIGLQQLLNQDIAQAEKQLQKESFDYLPLRYYQEDAIHNVEEAIVNGRREMLLAMATGTGKTITALALIYRLIKSKRFRRILFLVDRTSLGDQAFDKFGNVRLENQKPLTEIYDVKQLGDLKPDVDTKLQIATIQGMVYRVMNPDEDAEPVPVDWYDCIIIDECHRGYNLDQDLSEAELKFRDEAEYISKYRRVLDHFDAVRIGLTATPAKHTTEIFGQPVFNYSYRQGVIDGFLIDHEPPYQISTRLGEEGIQWQQDDEVIIYDSEKDEFERFNAPDEIKAEIQEFNRNVITEAFNQTVCTALADYIDPEIPGKTLIFCVNDLHADMVVRILKEAMETRYGKVHDDLVMKITGQSDKPNSLIRRFKNEALPKFGVTVDLLTTGIDVKEIVNLVFLRKVRSRILYDQMVGRATRTCQDLFGPGEDKERFYIFDPVKLYETLRSYTDMKPVVTRPNIKFSQLVNELQTVTDEEALSQIKDQLIAKLQRRNLKAPQEEKLATETGLSFEEFVNRSRSLTPKELGEFIQQHPVTFNLLDEYVPQKTRYIVSNHEDELISVTQGYGEEQSRPEDYLDSFKKYVTEHLDDLAALVVVTQRPKDLTRQQLKELKLEFDNAGFTETQLRTAWKATNNQDIAATIIGYIRHVSLDQPLMAHSHRVQAAMQKILSSRSWTPAQEQWLKRIGKQFEKEVIVDREALDAGEFRARGGFDRINKTFNGELEAILQSISDSMWQVAS